MTTADTLTIIFAQMTQNIGHLAANADAMRQVRAAHQDADLIVYPELQLIGYPPEDLVQKPALIERAAQYMAELAAETADGGPAMLVGSVERVDGKLYNMVALLDGGKVVAVRRKHELPNYGTFDEKRLFAAGPLPDVVEWRGVKLGLPICEDGWFPDVCGHLKAQGAEILLSVNGSPFEIEKDDRRLTDVFARRVAETGLPLAFLNRIGGQDELVFDGCSFVLSAKGELRHRLVDWDHEERVTRWTKQADGSWDVDAGVIAEWEAHPSDIYHAMVVALRDYVERNGFPGVVLGLSGGIDSAICAAVAADALGPDKVWCVMLPSQYTSDESLDDARGCAEMIGCRLDTISIAPAAAAFDQMLAPSFAGRAVDSTEENIQSRIRGVTLMGLSNKFGPMLMTTGNKSELSVGYATIYGDMAGGYNPLKDAYKTTVFALSRWRNSHVPRLSRNQVAPVMPVNIIDKPPSAELRPDQRDDDSLPPYDDLDRMLHMLVEEEASVDDVVARYGFDRGSVARIERLLAIAEYKRRQAPPGVKLSTRNFGRDRRYPITHGFRTA
ncbi:NAD+ synthase [Sphingopyxis yananensis]|uniref:NAD+ synthase n=1 Tax=Sphingopyxis yananensis TaxID=2886687 RepID=UPI001D12DDF8|nr:NAD+ synthase [Sphingopyxis yananensis]MCC2601331.1 NAD+ synthase [Sphingopyxis yananensis]